MIQLGYVETTTNVACTATTEATSNTVLTLPAITFNGTEIIILSFSCPSWTHSSTTTFVIMSIWDDLNGGGATNLGRIFASRAWVASASIMGFTVQLRLTPAAGSHVYSIRGRVSAASTFTIQAGAGGAGTADPAFLRALLVETG